MLQEIATLREIFSQPEVWTQCFDHLTPASSAGVFKGFSGREVEWLFVGCGTSFYLAQAAAHSFSMLLNVRARAVPASEILLFPSIHLRGTVSNLLPVLISRSGHTSEVVHVAELLHERKFEFVAVTCDGRELETMTPRLLKLPIQEESTVMTASFTGMLTGLQYLAASLAGDEAFLYALRSLPVELERLLQQYAPALKDFATKPFADAAFLGQGALYPIASETALKVMESSSTYAQFFHTLEFRHGPRSIAGPGTLVGALVSETGFDLEAPVLSEMHDQGASTIMIANSLPTDLHQSADLSIELGLPVPELARIAVYAVWGQLLGSYRGLVKGLNPDAPQNLSRVVTI